MTFYVSSDNPLDCNTGTLRQEVKNVCTFSMGLYLFLILIVNKSINNIHAALSRRYFKYIILGMRIKLFALEFIEIKQADQRYLFVHGCAHTL